jgi:hypothetical protein
MGGPVVTEAEKAEIWDRLFGFSEYLLLATFAGEIAGLGVAGGTPTTNATHQ